MLQHVFSNKREPGILSHRGLSDTPQFGLGPALFGAAVTRVKSFSIYWGCGNARRRARAVPWGEGRIICCRLGLQMEGLQIPSNQLGLGVGLGVGILAIA